MTIYQHLSPWTRLADGIVLGIDKVAIRIPWKPPSREDIIPNPKTDLQSKKDFLSHIHFIEEQITENFKVVVKKFGTGKIPNKLLTVKSQADGSHLATVALGLYYGTPILTFEFNPSKLGDEGRWELNLLFKLTLHAEYSTLYTRGVVKQIEFFIDVSDIKYGDLVLLDKGRRKTIQCGTTTYHGGRKSGLTAVMYDKANESKLDMLRTRFEWRIRRPDLTLQEFVESGVPNPLNPFMITPAEALATIEKEWKCPYLGHDICQRGLGGAIKNSRARQKITQNLEQQTVSWWDRDHLWDQFRLLTQGFRPSH